MSDALAFDRSYVCVCVFLNLKHECLLVLRSVSTNGIGVEGDDDII